MTGAANVKILYLVHDLSDAAVKKRVAMLLAGGASLTLAGFRRTEAPVESVAGCPAVDLGRTYNAGFARRIFSVVREALLLRRHRALFAEADIVIARNLEMLALAVRGCSLFTPAPKIVYECLDIHRLLLRRDMAGRLLRDFEGWCAKRAAALMTSSPAFVEHYFNVLSKVRLPVRLVENKVLAQALQRPAPMSRAPGPVWRIGWFGIIRCRKSLDILSRLVRSHPGKIEVIIRGKPAQDQFPDFDMQAGMEGIKFLGAYVPEELAAMYAGVHFTWAVDMFEEGLNSSWLLPNRLYEGGFYGSVPIAVASVETGRFLQRLGIGLTLDEPLAEALVAFFAQLTPERYAALAQAAAAVPERVWAYGAQDCRALVDYLSEVRHG